MTPVGEGQVQHFNTLDVFCSEYSSGPLLIGDIRVVHNIPDQKLNELVLFYELVRHVKQCGQVLRFEVGNLL